MRVCLVGHFDKIDEGVRNVARNLFSELYNNPEIEIIKTDIRSLLFNNKIKEFKPEIFHFVISPTITGIFVAKVVSFFFPCSKVIISAVHPNIPKNRLLKYLKPDLIFVQSDVSSILFEYLDYNVSFLYNGVDIEKFRPINSNFEKQKLKEKYGIPKDKFVILHLASFKKQRNLEIFKKLNDAEKIVVLIGRPKEKYDKHLIKEMNSSGCIVFIEHFTHIEDFFNLSDCYVFPTVDPKACIETPLSVLEALSCNIPVITTKFGSLPFLFEEGNGLYFVETDEDILKNLDLIKKGGVKLQNRSKVSVFRWSEISKMLLDCYKKIIKH
ncbi:glycosyltransferase family 4 protein [Methanobacterium sp. MZD130B]|uniref:glycosyltransferase family 4 protein n=1 Tax=Methanobacterium sp. MZD130B TaxID=3394378 RepID=UPI0039FBE204